MFPEDPAAGCMDLYISSEVVELVQLVHLEEVLELVLLEEVAAVVRCLVEILDS
jgi:hypothetical protein